MTPHFFKAAAYHFLKQEKRADLLRNELTRELTSPVTDPAKSWLRSLYSSLFGGKEETPAPEPKLEGEGVVPAPGAMLPPVAAPPPVAVAALPAPRSQQEQQKRPDQH